jgi:hypothetical protein
VAAWPAWKRAHSVSRSVRYISARQRAPSSTPRAPRTGDEAEAAVGVEEAEGGGGQRVYLR